MNQANKKAPWCGASNYISLEDHGLRFSISSVTSSPMSCFLRAFLAFIFALASILRRLSRWAIVSEENLSFFTFRFFLCFFL